MKKLIQSTKSLDKESFGNLVKKLTNESFGDFWKACRDGNEEKMEKLLLIWRNKINDQFEDSTPLFVACESGHVVIVKRLIGLEETDSNRGKGSVWWGQTPLYTACEKGYLSVVETLLSSPNIDVNKGIEYKNNTPLYIAAKMNHKEIVEVLLKSPNINVNKGEPISIALQKDHTEIVNMIKKFMDKKSIPYAI